MRLQLPESSQCALAREAALRADGRQPGLHTHGLTPGQGLQHGSRCFVAKARPLPEAECLGKGGISSTLRLPDAPAGAIVCNTERGFAVQLSCA